METIEVDFFNKDGLPDLSVERNTEQQIKTMFDFLDNSNKEAIFD